MAQSIHWASWSLTAAFAQVNLKSSGGRAQIATELFRTFTTEGQCFVAGGPRLFDFG